MPSTQRVTYTALDRSTQSIRLVEVLPGDSPQISCRLHVYQLDAIVDRPTFIALSYAWGPPDPASEILISVDDELFPVRKNLGQALSSYRKKMKEGIFGGLLWIDALCINQQDTLERNHQVNMMNLIFSKANAVLVWLGPEQDDSSRLFQFLGNMPSLAYSSDQGPPKRFARYTKGPHVKDLIICMPRPDFTIDDLFQELFDQKLDQAFAALFQRAYWRRLWIVQEVLLAKKLLILCGNHLCAWDTLIAIVSELDYLGQIYGQNGLPIRPQIPMPELNQLRSRVIGSQAYYLLTQGSDSDREQKRREGWNFREVIQIWHGQECEDPRDRVYGFLGLASGGITADYNKALDQIYVDVIASERLRMSENDDLVVFVNALTYALYDSPSPEQLEHLSQISGIDVEDALSFTFNLLPMLAWPEEEEYTADPPIIDYLDPTWRPEIHEHPD